MLSDWYFCCCIKSSPLRTKNFLLTLNLLDIHGVESPGIAAAIAELSRMDIWMRIYALPRVLKIHRSEEILPILTSKAIHFYFDTLIQHVPDSMRDAFDKLSSVLQDTECSAQEFFTSLNRCHASLPEVDESFISKVPYLDLDTFLPHILIIVALQSFTESELGQKQLERVLTDEVNSEGIKLGRMIRKAIDGLYGRMCQLSAISVGLAVLHNKPKDLLAPLWKQPETAPHLEPDIIEATASIVYSNTDRITEIADELITFRTWHDQIEPFFSLSPNSRLTLQLMGLGGRAVEQALPLALWHTALCDLIVDKEPSQAVSLLTPIWAPRRSNRNLELRVTAPFKVPERDVKYFRYKKTKDKHNKAGQEWNTRWQEDLTKIANAQVGITITVKAQPGAFQFPEYLRWSIFSPWIKFRLNDHKPFPEYHGWNHPFSLLRLVAAVNTSIRILNREENTREILLFSGLICHAAGVLNSFRYQQKKLSPPVEALAMTGQTLVTNAGIGNYPTISTEMFLDLLHTENALGTLSPKTKKVSREEEQLIYKIFPENILMWISDAYTQTPPTLGNERTGLLAKDTISRVLDMLNGQTHHTVHIKRSLLTRRFMSKLAPYEESAFKISKISHHHDLLLVEPDLPQQPPIADKVKPHLLPLIKLVQAVHRVSSEGENQSDQIQRYQDDLLARLSSVSHPIDIDQFTRLRLINLLEESALAHWPEGQITIIQVLMDVGQGEQLGKLFRALLRLACSTDTSLEKAFKFTVTALERLLKEYSSRIQNIDLSQPPQNPYWTLNEEGRHHLMENFLFRLISTASHLGKQTSSGLSHALSIRIKELRQTHLSNQSDITEQVHKVEVRHNRREGTIPLDWNVLQAVKTNLTAASWDKNHQQASLVTCFPRLRGNTINLFALDRKTQEHKLSARTKPGSDSFVLSRVVWATEVRPNDNRQQVIYNVGLPYLLEGGVSKETSADIASKQDFVTTKLWRDKRHTWKAASSATWQLSSLEETVQDNSLFQFEIEIKEVPASNQHTNLPQTKIICNSLSIPHGFRILQDFWFPDISCRFCSCQPQKYAIYAEGNPSQILYPVAGDFLDLLIFLDEQSYQTDFPIVFIDRPELDEAGISSNFLFAASPAQHFLLQEGCFLPDDFIRLNDFLVLSKQEFDTVGLTGLIVHVRPTKHNDKIYLTLAEDDAAFDTRNLKWRNLFRSETTMLAQRTDTGDWVIDLDEEEVVLGFPQQIFVGMRGSLGNQNVTEVQIVDWNYRENRAHAVPVTTNKFEPKNRTLRELVEAILLLKKGDRLRVNRVLGRVGSYQFVPCLTDESVSIHVDVNTLQLTPVAGDEILLENDIDVRLCYDPRWNPAGCVDAIWEEDTSLCADPTGKLIGIITSVPRRGDQGNHFGVCWLNNNKVAGEGWIQLNASDSLRNLKIFPGTRIEGRIQNQQGQFDVLKLHVMAETLWQIVPPDTKWKSCRYLGIPGNDTRNFGVLCPGHLIDLSDRIGTQKKTLFSQVNSHSQDIKKGWSEKTEVYVDLTPKQAKYRQCVVRNSGEKLFGLCYLNTQNGCSTVASMNWKLFPADDKETSYALWRCFSFTPKKKKTGTRYREEDKQSWETWWSNYRSNPHPIEGRIDKKKGYFYLLHQHKIRDPKPLKIPSDEGTFVKNAVYSSVGYAIALQHEQYGPSVSFREVKPHNLEKFWSHELGSPDLDSPVILSDMNDSSNQQFFLHYVGVAGSEEKHPDDFEERQHLFEWGYGKLLQVSEKQLRFRGLPFQAGELSLFHGDQVSRIIFLAKGNKEIEAHEGNDEYETYLSLSELILSVEDLVFSPARRLYLQSKLDNLLHVLDVELSEEKRPVVVSVDTFSGRDNRTTLRTIPLEASLDDASCQRLLSYYKAKHGDNALRKEHVQRQRTHVMGRMNIRRFEGSLGRDIEYTHTVLQFNNPESGLLDGDRLFLECGSIERMPNDWLLKLHPLEILNEYDIGKEMKNLGLLRRAFSAREDALSRIVELQGENALQETGVVLVAQVSSGKKFVQVDIQSNPVRQIGALHTLLEAQQGKAFAVVAEDSEPDFGIKLELRPGIFVQVEPKHIQSCSKKLKKGAVISVELTNQGNFVIERAMFGQTRYFSALRPVVTLPMNSLFNEEIWKSPVQRGQYWKKRANFTLGGFPNLTAQLSGYFDNKWQPLELQRGTRFMQTPFPMVGMAELSGEPEREGEIVRFRPPDKRDQSHWCMGRLDYSEERVTVRCVKLAKNENQIMAPDDQAEVPWRWLTFGDQTVVEVLQRIDDNEWRYHDQTTNCWPEQYEELPQKIHLRAWNSIKGPVFFQMRDELNNQAVLRYSQQELTKFCFPVETLLSILRTKTKAIKFVLHRFPVIAYNAKGKSFWLEISPGCIVEVPLRLCQILIGGKAQILRQFDWSAFAIGDHVELALVPSQDRFAIDQMMLRWEPGVRRVLGKGCILPRKEIHSEQGGAVYGVGCYTITLPSNKPEQLPDLAQITPDNYLKKLEAGFFPSPNDVVLLTLTSENKVEVAGFPDLQAFPDFKSNWEDDPLHAFFVQQDHEDRWRVHQRNIIALLQATGGAVPVTVQHVNKQQARLYYSRSAQKYASIIPNDRYIVTRLLGICKLRNTITGIVLWAGGLIRIPAKDLVLGLPPKNLQAAANELIANQVDIWVRQVKQKNCILPAMEHLRYGECIAEVVACLSSDQSVNSKSGLILQERKTQTLLWLPANKLAWTEVTDEELLSLFPFGTALAVYVTDVGASVIDRKQVRKKFEDSAIGREMTAAVLKERTAETENRLWLLRSLELGVLLECRTLPEHAPLKQEEEIAVEVIDRHYGTPPLLAVTLIGSRKFQVMLPKWLLELTPDERRKKRACHEQRSTWLKTPIPKNNESHYPSMRDLGNDELEQIICQSMASLHTPGQFLSNAYMAAWEWTERNISRREMDAIPALASLYIFYTCMEYRNWIDCSRLSPPREINFIRSCYSQTFKLAHNVGRRAICSMHVEILSNIFCKEREAQQRGLWPRLWEIEEKLQKEVNIEQVELIRRYCHTVSFTDNKEHAHIANALSAALGELPDNRACLQEHAKAINKILTFYRTVPPISSTKEEEVLLITKKESLRLWSCLLKEAFDYIDFQGIDLTLLEALPDVSQKRG
ncbi:MAG: hypothetical protein ACI8ZB_001507 [Desulforhopalus sp.]|jgi:hypothetical protein